MVVVRPGAPRPPMEAEPFVMFREEAKQAAKAHPPKPAAVSPSPAPKPEGAPQPAPAIPVAPAPPSRPVPIATRPALTSDEIRRLREEARKRALAAEETEGEG